MPLMPLMPGGAKTQPTNHQPLNPKPPETQKQIELCASLLYIIFHTEYNRHLQKTINDKRVYIFVVWFIEF